MAGVKRPIETLFNSSTHAVASRLLGLRLLDTWDSRPRLAHAVASRLGDLGMRM